MKKNGKQCIEKEHEDKELLENIMQSKERTKALKKMLFELEKMSKKE